MESVPVQRLLETALCAARVGAYEMMRMRGSFAVSAKGRNDLVTDADVAAQAAILRIVRESFPDHLFVGEESGANDTKAAAKSSQYTWVVDPIDGTANYVHGLQGFAVSIAVVQNGIPIVGVILDPVAQETFTAVIDGGARVNGNLLKASGCNELSEAMIACSFPPNTKHDSVDVRRFGQVLERCQSIRRLGSAALNLCYVAAGRLDGYWATCVNAWDVAAGFLIAKEAGAVILNLQGKPVDIWEPKFIAAASLPLHQELAGIINRVKA